MSDPSFIENSKISKKRQTVFYNNLLNIKTQVEPLNKSLTLEISVITYYVLDKSASTTRYENISSVVAVINTSDSRIKILLTLEVRPAI